MPEFFRRWAPKPFQSKTRMNERRRGSASERGYDGEWQKLQKWYRKEHPFCEECERRGYLEPMVYVDHMVPIADAPERRLDKTNLQSLCASCHQGFKRRIEAYARAANKVQYLAEWCREPEKRPKPFRIAPSA